MADTMTKAQRHAVMSHIRSRDTKPEKLLRSLVHRQGFRFRICRKDLPGRPDLVLRRHRTCVFVHGCFWHRHGCGNGTMPKSNVSFWMQKWSRNVKRDKR
ncbi:MAG: DNA mismatch endonuclease Vsr, partial [Desulfovibrio sp.]|nr:DNA mismatch endonuclease Vsr [Desulfovibrio sp.]